jgi:hypothetical protein
MASAIGFENVLIPGLVVSANVGMTEGTSTAGFPADPNPSAVQVDQATTFTFGWGATGALASWLVGSGAWKFDVFYELFGPGEATFPIPSQTLLNPAVTGTSTITVAPNTVPEGVYRVVIRMMLLQPGGVGPSPICGFSDLGLVEYYKG